MVSNSAFWDGLPKIVVTVEHVDRAMRAMDAETANLTANEVDHLSAVLAGSVIAHMEAFDERVRDASLLCALAEESISSTYLKDWAILTFGLVDPKEDATEHERAEHKRLGRLRAAKAKARRSAGRAAAKAAADLMNAIGADGAA